MKNAEIAQAGIINYMHKIYVYVGLIFFFYANEHLPIHVHVAKADRESKIELVFGNGKLTAVEIKKVKGMGTHASKFGRIALKIQKANETI